MGVGKAPTLRIFQYRLLVQKALLLRELLDLIQNFQMLLKDSLPQASAGQFTAVPLQAAGVLRFQIGQPKERKNIMRETLQIFLRNRAVRLPAPLPNHIL